MLNASLYPSLLHQHAVEAIVTFFCRHAGVDAVLLVNSCARGVATPESDLDMAVLVSLDLSSPDARSLEQQWRNYLTRETVFQQLRAVGRFTGVHLDLIDGTFTPETWDDGGGPDGFELAIGNAVAYSRPLWEGTNAFQKLRGRWLPYYDTALQKQRLTMARDACLYDLDHIPFYTARGLYFQAFDRLYKAYQEFLQALFIARRTYPIAYNKWIREQVDVHLGLPELYPHLPPLLEIPRLESDTAVYKAQLLRQLVEEWAAS